MDLSIPGQLYEVCASLVNCMKLVHPWPTLWSITGKLYEACASLANSMKHPLPTVWSLSIPGQLYEACESLANCMKLVHPWPTVWRFASLANCMKLVHPWPPVWSLYIPGQLYEACASLTNRMKLVHPWPNLCGLLSSETVHTLSWVADCKLFCKCMKLLQQKLNPDCAFQVYGLCSIWCVSWIEFWKTRYFILPARGSFVFWLQRFWDLSCAPLPVGTQRWNIDFNIVYDRVVTAAHAYSEISGFDFPIVFSIFRNLLQSNAVSCLKISHNFSF